MNKVSKLFIGIDPGVNTGVAGWSTEEKKLVLFTMTFWEAIDYLKQVSDITSTVVVIEDVTQNKPTFNRNMNVRANTRISQNVGQNKRDCQLIIEWCELNNIEVIRVRPTKGSLTKLDADQFKKITGYEGRSSSHSRDAAMLVFGRS